MAASKQTVINWVNVLPRMRRACDLNTVAVNNLWRLNAVILASDVVMLRYHFFDFDTILIRYLISK